MTSLRCILRTTITSLCVCVILLNESRIEITSFANERLGSRGGRSQDLSLTVIVLEIKIFFKC